MKLLLLSLLFAVSCSNLSEKPESKKYEVLTKEIIYKSGKTQMKGYLALPKGLEKAPAVIVVHEWWGQTEYPRMRARMLAESGYAAFAIDMYGNGKTASHPKEAGKFASETMKNFKESKKKFEIALSTLKRQPEIDPERIAAVGYCFGGGLILEMSRVGVGLKSAVSFHGSLKGMNKIKNAQEMPKLLILNGAADPMVPKESVEAFKKEMDTAKVDYQFVNYPGALHAFSNPEATEKGKKFNIPIAYDESADKNSWQRMIQFLGETL